MTKIHVYSISTLPQNGTYDYKMLIKYGHILCLFVMKTPELRTQRRPDKIEKTSSSIVRGLRASILPTQQRRGNQETRFRFSYVAAAPFSSFTEPFVFIEKLKNTIFAWILRKISLIQQVFKIEYDRASTQTGTYRKN